MTFLPKIKHALKGDFYYGGIEGDAIRTLYATDASVYQEMPLAVALPRDAADIQTLIRFANEFGFTLIPRAAGTSLAGQVVGNGVVVDCSTYMNQILELNVAEKWVRVQPGVIRDDLNKYIRPFGLLFGPETSTASRAMIGGMVGNNSSGLHSIKWGHTRDHVLETQGFLSDGSPVVFKSLDDKALAEKERGDTLENKIYRGIGDILRGGENLKLIREKFPKPSIRRRNTGYALDFLAESKPYTVHDAPFSPQDSFGEARQNLNISHLISGSEGTLCFLTEIKLNLIDLPPAQSALLCVHFQNMRDCMEATVIAMQHQPYAVELVDKLIMDFTRQHPTYAQNCFFIEADPAAILMIEFFDEPVATNSRPKTAYDLANALAMDLRQQNKGYAYPILMGSEANLAWDVRKAGLGMIRNQRGKAQPVNLIEDCAVAIEDLPNYVDDVAAILKRHQVQASYYAHAGAGELHIEPMLDLKSAEGVRLFRQILTETVALLKKYNGSLSGEHGDGRLRGEFIPELMGQEVYALFKQVKQLFDPKGIFNAGKIVDTPPMDSHLRYTIGQNSPNIPTTFRFNETDGGILRLAEKCSGSGDCRKTHLSGGTMCPSYMASRREHDTTRARANILRQFLTKSDKPNRFNHAEIKDVMDTCLSCKACKSECPTAVDVAKMKAEFLQNYYDVNGLPLRSRLIGSFSTLMKCANLTPSLFNAFFGVPLFRRLSNRLMGFHPDRTMPHLSKRTLRSWYTKRPTPTPSASKASVYFFCDEFTNYNDAEIGQKAIELLEALGYHVIMPKHVDSGRAQLSKGLVRKAQLLATENVRLLKDLITAETPLIGLEPSAILGFRDEYLDLVPLDLKAAATHIAQNSFLIDEFLAKEAEAGRISAQAFREDKKQIKLHGHCHQKALSQISATVKILSLPPQYQVDLIPSGCCGMAGSFGYEAEHYDLSMKVGELVLFPSVRASAEDVLIAATGTSCRHQILDGTARRAFHPVEILWSALR
jgi:FAD/FMN-containing dehydrogenase/Fe-S oxidoreductase